MQGKNVIGRIEEIFTPPSFYTSKKQAFFHFLNLIFSYLYLLSPHLSYLTRTESVPGRQNNVIFTGARQKIGKIRAKSMGWARVKMTKPARDFFSVFRHFHGHASKLLILLGFFRVPGRHYCAWPLDRRIHPRDNGASMVPAGRLLPWRKTEVVSFPFLNLFLYPNK